jgi:hypothetical protein
LIHFMLNITNLVQSFMNIVFLSLAARNIIPFADLIWFFFPSIRKVEYSRGASTGNSTKSTARITKHSVMVTSASKSRSGGRDTVEDDNAENGDEQDPHEAQKSQELQEV